MPDMTHNYAIHVVRASGTSFTLSNHRVARGALRSIREFLSRPVTNPLYAPRSVQVWSAGDNKHHSLESFAEAVRLDLYA